MRRSAASRSSRRADGLPPVRPAPRTSTRSTPRVFAATAICALSCAKHKPSSTQRWPRKPGARSHAAIGDGARGNSLSRGGRPDAICPLEEATRLGDDLAVAHVLQRLNAEQTPGQHRRMAVQPGDEFRLRRRGTDDKELLGLAERRSDVAMERGLSLVVGPRGAARFVVKMVRGVCGIHRLLVDVIGIEVNDAVLMMIDPDDGMIVRQATLRS